MKWVYHPIRSEATEYDDNGNIQRTYEFNGLNNEYPGERVKTKLSITYEEAWTLWAAHRQCPRSCFVTGCAARPHYRRHGLGGWAISDEGMPYKLSKTVQETMTVAMEIEE